MEAGGQRDLTPMEQDTAAQLRHIINTGGEVPASALGQRIESDITRLLETGGARPGEEQRMAMGIDAARSPLDILRRGQLSQGSAALAGRGMLGSGAGGEFGERLEERLAPQYTAAAQRLELDRRAREDARYEQALGLGAQRAGQREALQQQRLSGALGESARISAQREQARDSRLSDAMSQSRLMTADESAQRQDRYLTAIQNQMGISRDEAMFRENRLNQALGLATGMSQAQSQNLLNTANTVTDRQRMYSDIAMRGIDQIMAWNQFLAQFSLDRYEVMERLQQGRFDSLLPLLSMMFGAAGQAGQGYIRNP